MNVTQTQNDGFVPSQRPQKTPVRGDDEMSSSLQNFLFDWLAIPFNREQKPSTVEPACWDNFSCLSGNSKMEILSFQAN